MADRFPPGPHGWPLVGNLPAYRRDPLGLFLRVFERYGDIASLRFGPARVIMLAHPDDIKHVFQDNNSNYHKSIIYRPLRPLLGNGLLLSEDDFWRQQRRLAQPAFHRQRLADLAGVMTAGAAELLARWQPYVQQRQSVDVASELMRITLSITARALFSTDISDQAAAVGRALTTVLLVTNQRMENMAFNVVPYTWPTPANRRFDQARRVLDDVVQGIITARRQQAAAGNDLLGLLMSARDEDTGAAMSDMQLRDEVMTLLLAGHETTANTLTFALWQLAEHPAHARTLRAEARAALAGRAPTLADLPALPYTRMVIDETLRLYPPVWAVGRQTLAADTVRGYTLPPNQPISISPYVTHRHPAFWDNPQTFDPERWRNPDPNRPRYAYLPFAGGPRQCIGNQFALMEAAILLAHIVQHCQLEVDTARPFRLQAGVTLRAHPGLWLKLSPPSD